MKTILVWYLVSYGYNYMPIWSPPMPNVEECVRVQGLMELVGRGRCVQINEVVK